jgi:hypothetical protein
MSLEGTRTPPPEGDQNPPTRRQQDRPPGDETLQQSRNRYTRFLSTHQDHIGWTAAGAATGLAAGYIENIAREHGASETDSMVHAVAVTMVLTAGTMAISQGRERTTSDNLISGAIDSITRVNPALGEALQRQEVERTQLDDPEVVGGRKKKIISLIKEINHHMRSLTEKQCEKFITILEELHDGKVENWEYTSKGLKHIINKLSEEIRSKMINQRNWREILKDKKCNEFIEPREHIMNNERSLSNAQKEEIRQLCIILSNIAMHSLENVPENRKEVLKNFEANCTKLQVARERLDLSLKKGTEKLQEPRSWEWWEDFEQISGTDPKTARVVLLLDDHISETHQKNMADFIASTANNTEMPPIVLLEGHQADQPELEKDVHRYTRLLPENVEVKIFGWDNESIGADADRTLGKINKLQKKIYNAEEANDWDTLAICYYQRYQLNEEFGDIAIIPRNKSLKETIENKIQEFPDGRKIIAIAGSGHFTEDPELAIFLNAYSHAVLKPIYQLDDLKKEEEEYYKFYKPLEDLVDDTY